MTHGRMPALQGGLLAVLSAVLFGLTTPLLKQVGEGVGPFTTAAWLYLGASAVTFALYWQDKHSAISGRWRVSENRLHLAELLGGWPGALLAQQVFRHKTRKLSFQLLCWGIVLLHQVFWLDQLFLGGTLGFLVYGLAGTGWMFMLGLPISALWAIAAPATQALITRQVPADAQGRIGKKIRI